MQALLPSVLVSENAFKHIIAPLSVAFLELRVSHSVI